MAKPIDQLKQTKHNWLFLFQLGYGLVALPLALFNFASIGYYLVVINYAILMAIFPNFPIFLVFGIVIGPIICIVVGLIYAKSPYYRANYEIATDANPYSFKLMPRDIPLCTAVAKLCEKEGLQKEADELKKIIEDSLS